MRFRDICHLQSKDRKNTSACGKEVPISLLYEKQPEYYVWYNLDYVNCPKCKAHPLMKELAASRMMERMLQ